MKSPGQQLLDELLFRLHETEMHGGDPLDNVEYAMKWLGETGHQAALITELRRILDPATRVRELDYRAEEEVLRRLVAQLT